MPKQICVVYTDTLGKGLTTNSPSNCNCALDLFAKIYKLFFLSLFCSSCSPLLNILCIYIYILFATRCAARCHVLLLSINYLTIMHLRITVSVLERQGGLQNGVVTLDSRAQN